MTYSIVIITFRRDGALAENLEDLRQKVGVRDDIELVLVDNNEDTKDRSSMLRGFRNPVYLKLGVNRGVAGGRNAGVASSHGQILIFLDDDAFIGPIDFPDRLSRLFNAEAKLGIIAFRSFNYYTGKMDRAEFPHTNKNRNPERSFKTFRFIGVGHAIRRAVFEKAGLYDDEFFYAMEEFDLSFRAIKMGFQIQYVPDVEVRHKKNASGRLPSKLAVEQTLLNKLRVNYMHLPLAYAFVSNCIWFGYSFYRSRGRADLRSVWVKYQAWAALNAARRVPFDTDARRYLSACGARLWT